MPDTTLNGYRLDATADQPLPYAPIEAGTLFGYPSPVLASNELPPADITELPTLEQPATPMVERLEPGTPTAPAPAMSVSFESLPPTVSFESFESLPPRAAIAPPSVIVDHALEPAPRQGILPVAVISDDVAAPVPRSLAWNDEPASAGPVDVWSEREATETPVDTSSSFDDFEGPALHAKPVKSGPPVLLLGVGLVAAMGVVGVAAALFLLSNGSPAPEARAFRRAPAPTAVAAAEAPARAAEAPVALNVPAATAPAAAASAPSAPAVAPVSPAPVAPAARAAVVRERTANAPSPSPTTPRRARRSSSSGGGAQSLDDAPMATGAAPPSFDLGNSLAPLLGGGGGAPVPQAGEQIGESSDDDSLASLGERAAAVGGSQPDSQTPVSAPPPMAPAPRPGDEVDWDVPFGG